jgi:hypothetical protein
VNAAGNECSKRFHRDKPVRRARICASRWILFVSLITFFDFCRSFLGAAKIFERRMAHKENQNASS